MHSRLFVFIQMFVLKKMLSLFNVLCLFVFCFLSLWLLYLFWCLFECFGLFVLLASMRDYVLYVLWMYCFPLIQWDTVGAPCFSYHVTVVLPKSRRHRQFYEENCSASPLPS